MKELRLEKDKEVSDFKILQIYYLVYFLDNQN